MPALIQDLKEFRPDFVVIDSLSTANRFSTYQESQMEYARPILEMTGLAHEYGCTFVIIHHTNRDGGVRGTTAIRNAVSEVWQLTKDNSQHSTPNDRLLEINKSRSRSSGKKYRMIFNPEDLSFTFLGEEETGETTGLADKTTQNTLLDFFANNRNTKYTSEELAHITGYSKGNVRRCLGLLSADGLISRQPGKPNLYFLAMEGSDPQVITDHTRSHHDHTTDHTKNPGLARLTDDNDHVITKNAPVENFTDQRSCDPEPPNDHCGLEALQNKETSCDHQVIIPDQRTELETPLPVKKDIQVGQIWWWLPFAQKVEIAQCSNRARKATVKSLRTGRTAPAKYGELYRLPNEQWTLNIGHLVDYGGEIYAIVGHDRQKGWQLESKTGSFMYAKAKQLSKPEL